MHQCNMYLGIDINKSLRCVGERKKVFLPDITRVQRLNSQAGGPASQSLNQDVSFRGFIISNPDHSTPSVSITSSYSDEPILGD